jgi:hypothetical protein
MPRVIKDIHLHIFWGHFGEGLYKAVKSKRVVRETHASRDRVGGRHGGTTACRDFGNST